MESATLLFIQRFDDCVASELEVIPLQVNHSTGEPTGQPLYGEPQYR